MVKSDRVVKNYSDWMDAMFAWRDRDRTVREHSRDGGGIAHDERVLFLSKLSRKRIKISERDGIAEFLPDNTGVPVAIYFIEHERGAWSSETDLLVLASNDENIAAELVNDGLNRFTFSGAFMALLRILCQLVRYPDKFITETCGVVTAYADDNTRLKIIREQDSIDFTGRLRGEIVEIELQYTDPATMTVCALSLRDDVLRLSRNIDTPLEQTENQISLHMFELHPRSFAALTHMLMLSLAEIL